MRRLSVWVSHWNTFLIRDRQVTTTVRLTSLNPFTSILSGLCSRSLLLTSIRKISSFLAIRSIRNDWLEYVRKRKFDLLSLSSVSWILLIAAHWYHKYWMKSSQTRGEVPASLRMQGVGGLGNCQIRKKHYNNWQDLYQRKFGNISFKNVVTEIHNYTYLK